MSQSINNMSVSWTDSGTTYSGIKLSVTDTASAAGSNLLELRGGAAGTTSVFSVSKTGATTIGAGAQITNQSGSGLEFVLGGTNVLRVRGGEFRVNGSTFTFGFSSGDPLLSVNDVTLARDAADTLAQRRATNPQTFRIYNTYTDASNYERAKIAWESNVLVIGTEKLGSGSNRGLNLSWDGGNGRIDFITSASNASGTRIYTPGNGKLAIMTSSNGAGTLAFGIATSSFGQIKGVATTLQARLADDSAFTNIQGKLTTETAYTAGAPTATGYLVLYDSNGTAYKVPAEAL